MMETSMKVIGFTSYLSDFIIKVYFFFNYLILQAYLYVPENLLLSRMIYTHVLNKGGMGVKSPLDMTGSSDLPPVINRQSWTFS